MQKTVLVTKVVKVEKTFFVVKKIPVRVAKIIKVPVKVHGKTILIVEKVLSRNSSPW